MTEDRTTSRSTAAGHHVATPCDAAVDARTLVGAENRLADLIARLEARLERLETVVDSGQEKRSEAVSGVARIELAQRQSHEVLLGQIGQLGQRLDRMEAALAAADGKDALARIELAQRQSHEVLLGQIGQVGARLDRTELVAAEMRRTLRSLAEDVAGVVSDLRAAAKAIETPAFLFFPTVGHAASLLDRAILEAVEGRLGNPPGVALYLRDDRHHQSASAAVRAALDRFVAARKDIQADSGLLWLLPPARADEVTDEELCHAIGLLGHDALCVRPTGDSACTVVVAVRRAEIVVPIIRWTTATMRTRPPVAHGLPAFVLEGHDDDNAASQWADEVAEFVTRLVRARGDSGDAPELGLIWPRAVLTAPEPFLRTARFLCSRLAELGLAPLFQWLEGVPAVEDSAAIIDLAERIGASFDLTPTVRAQTAAAFAAYDELVPYPPMSFDLRLPALAASDSTSNRLICIARQDTSLLPALDDPFEATVAARKARLARVLDRRTAARSLAAATARGVIAGTWEIHTIYNWAPPEPLWVRALILEADSEESGFMPQPGLVRGTLSEIRSRWNATHRTARQDYRREQIAAHAYLPNRLESSPDSLRITRWFAPDLGDTLEIGCGFGVLARTFIDRTRTYVGFDLTVEQARAVQALGGHGIVADMHDLPFHDSSFDTVVADNAIEHSFDPVRALAEIRRVLRPHGRAFLVVPFDYLGPDYRLPAHLWKADERSIDAALKRAGLVVVRHEVCVLPQVGVPGSFPSCDQRTSLWEVAPDPATPKPSRQPVPPEALDWRAMLLRVDARAAAAAADATRTVVRLNQASDLTPLARRSPALRGFDWTSYLELSQIRIVRAAHYLQQRMASGRVLDLGAYFGNFAMTLGRLGFQVAALDAYADVEPAFDRHVAAMRELGIEVLDSTHVGIDMTAITAESFDAVLCMGVIEHVPHTPRPLLEAIDRVLRRGGWLIMDTPNLAYEYKRRDLLAGKSIFAPIASQYESEVPFEGHHREYTVAEVRWMLERLGYGDIEIDTYNYSVYGLSEVSGLDLECWHAMAADPERRELIFAAARKPF